MKKLIYTLILALTFSTTVMPAFASDAKPKTELTIAQRAELANIMSRVDEIRGMDKSNLTKVERKALRTELKDMKKRANGLNQGVYLSVGAIIVIILLLILIL